MIEIAVEIAEATGLATLRARGLDGSGATVCIVDTGVDRDHPDLGGVARESEDDRHGHGTALASIVAAVAPGVTLLAIDAYDETQRGFEDADLIAGLAGCEGADVVLLAAASQEGGHDGTTELELAIERMASGVPVVVAAGNADDALVHRRGAFGRDGLRLAIGVPSEGASIEIHSDVPFAVDGETTTRVHIDGAGLHGLLLSAADPFARFDAYVVERGSPLFPAEFRGGDRAPVAVPATAPSSIAVSAYDATFEPAAYAPSGPTRNGLPKPDLIAPGGPWDAAVAGSEDRASVEGTSYAAAFVAGALALALTDEPWRGEADRRLLLAMADGAAFDSKSGFGRIAIDAFVDARPRDRAPVGLARGELAFTRVLAAARGHDVAIVAKIGDDAGPIAEGTLRLRGDVTIDAPIVEGIAIAPLIASDAPRLAVRGYVDGVAIGSAAIDVAADEIDLDDGTLAGGCAVASRASSSWLALALAALSVWCRRSACRSAGCRRRCRHRGADSIDS